MRRFFTLLSSALLLAALFATYAGVARIYANTAQHQLPDVTCSGNGCNGLDPETTGCARGAITVPGGTVSFSTGTGTVELRFSPTCGTNWGRVRSAVDDDTQLWVSIRRNDGLFYFAVRSDRTRLWSPMVFAPRVTAQACGSVNHFEFCTKAL